MDDRGWWLWIVEFQPSGWARGSYLNVGCMWLWQVKDHVTFDEGYRVQGVSTFCDEGQFDAAAAHLASKAAKEVARYRKLFPNARKVAKFYWWHRPIGIWANFNAAVACALSGQSSDARRFFDRVAAEEDNGIDWVATAKADAERIATIATEVEQFRRIISERVQRTRGLLKLRSTPIVNFDE